MRPKAEQQRRVVNGDEMKEKKKKKKEKEKRYVG